MRPSASQHVAGVGPFGMVRTTSLSSPPESSSGGGGAPQRRQPYRRVERRPGSPSGRARDMTDFGLIGCCAIPNCKMLIGPRLCWRARRREPLPSKSTPVRAMVPVTQNKWGPEMVMVNDSNTADVRSLTGEEIDAVSGGILPLVVALGAVAVWGLVGMAVVVAEETPAFINHMTDSGSNVKKT
jgi:hypothetical protein